MKCVKEIFPTASLIHVQSFCLLIKPIGPFRVAPSLCFNARQSAKPLIWKWLFILMQIKLIFTKHQAKDTLDITDLICRTRFTWTTKSGRACHEFVLLSWVINQTGVCGKSLGWMRANKKVMTIKTKEQQKEKEILLIRRCWKLSKIVFGKVKLNADLKPGISIPCQL